MVGTYGLTHIGLAVRDMERSLRFYERLLGVAVLYRDEHSIQVQTPGSHDVIVFEQDRRKAGVAGGISHIGFRLRDARDIEAAVGDVRAAGGTILRRGEFVPGEPYVFVSDPDGYEVELWFELDAPEKRAGRSSHTGFVVHNEFEHRFLNFLASAPRTRFGSFHAAESRPASVKGDSDCGVPNPTSSSGLTEEFEMVTIAGMSSRFARRIRIPGAAAIVARWRSVLTRSRHGFVVAKLLANELIPNPFDWRTRSKGTRSSESVRWLSVAAVACVVLASLIAPLPTNAAEPLVASLDYSIRAAPYQNSVHLNITGTLDTGIAVDRDLSSPYYETIYVLRGYSSPPADFKIRRSLDGGRTFGDPIPVDLCSGFNNTNCDVGRPGIAVGSGGAAYIVDPNQATGEVAVLRSVDQGVSWLPVVSFIDFGGSVSIATDAATGTVYVGGRRSLRYSPRRPVRGRRQHMESTRDRFLRRDRNHPERRGVAGKRHGRLPDGEQRIVRHRNVRVRDRRCIPRRRGHMAIRDRGLSARRVECLGALRGRLTRRNLRDLLEFVGGFRPGSHVRVRLS